MTNPKSGLLLSQANMVLAHRQVYALIRQNEREKGLPLAPIGVAHLLMDSRAYSFGADEGSTLFIDVYARYLFIDLVKDVIDFCGVNYYGLEVVSGMGSALKPEEVEYSGSGRGIEPTGLYNLLQQFHERYTDDPHAKFLREDGYGFVITENGIADETDMLRPAYMIEHLMAIDAARRRGIRVRGYTHWTTSDNWEWADGYCPKFGLCAVNRSDPSLPRIPRESYHLFSEIVHTRRITAAQREWAWDRVTKAAATGTTHLVCRAPDAESSLEEPEAWPLLSGTTLPSGVVVDWRFDESKTNAPGKKDNAASATDMISSAMRLSAKTGLDPVAAIINGVAELSHALRTPPPPAPMPTSGLEAPDIGDYFDLFRDSFLDAVGGTKGEDIASNEKGHDSKVKDTSFQSGASLLRTPRKRPTPAPSSLSWESSALIFYALALFTLVIVALVRSSIRHRAADSTPDLV